MLCFLPRRRTECDRLAMVAEDVRHIHHLLPFEKRALCDQQWAIINDHSYQIIRMLFTVNRLLIILTFLEYKTYFWCFDSKQKCPSFISFCRWHSSFSSSSAPLRCSLLLYICTSASLEATRRRRAECVRQPSFLLPSI